MIKLRISILVLIVVIVGGSIFAAMGYFTNQELSEITELPEIKSQYEKLETYKIELEKINQNNQKILADLENQIANSDDENLTQINEEIEVIKRVINENKEELEQVIEKLSEMESDQ